LTELIENANYIIQNVHHPSLKISNLYIQCVLKSLKSFMFIDVCFNESNVFVYFPFLVFLISFLYHLF